MLYTFSMCHPKINHYSSLVIYVIQIRNRGREIREGEGRDV